MRRDFSEEYKQKLIRMIRENESEQWSGFTDWIGDRLLDFGHWTGYLDLIKYISGIDAYTKLILDKNDIGVETIEEIFRLAYAKDDECAETINGTLYNQLASYKELLLSMKNVISPTGSGFTVTQISTLIGVIENLEKSIVLNYDKAFDENIHDIVYDKNGDKRSIKDITDPDKDKVIKAYEEAHPDWKEDLEKLVKSGDPNTLTEEDIRNIKYIAYTAEEPYRSIYLDNVRKYSIGGIGDNKNKVYTVSGGQVKGALFDPNDNSVKFFDHKSRFYNDTIWPYRGWYHEAGHAIDWNDSQGTGYSTATYTVYSEELGREITFQEAIEHDVYSNIESRIRAVVSDDASVERILDAFRYGNSIDGLTKQEKQIYNNLIIQYNKELKGREDSAASDVYGIITDKKVIGAYGHEAGYGYDDEGNPNNMGSLELWAEYFSFCMTGDEESLESLREYFPEASKILDQIVEEMERNVGA